MWLLCTWLYLWSWFLQVYLWLDKYVLETCMYLWIATWNSWSLICTCVYMYFWQECVFLGGLHVLVICQSNWPSLICTCVYTCGQTSACWDLHLYTWEYPQCYIDFGRVLASSPSVLLVDFCLCVHPHGSIGCFGARKAEARQRW